ncbi:endoglucanase [Geoalkalibacter ferrihydriticus]|uniref:Hydrolase n=2 Tax=Geoalkalibacter ferrihydriticus TaxID=392333 RepID=A0A0C2HV66_9BACT|nr:M42 family metallopeptidase [Geoalkalibacter ferrihydriticus]KIH76667.1 hydrolase [Geoalkalibacter ferrihydriticus DSM 17813]SDM05669.1 endoglucanase [Geoalkalibacter ferrihydriticus]
MTDQNFSFLKELVEAPSPSGFEQPAQRVIRRHLDGVVDELTTDVMGNVIGLVKGQGENLPRVMLAGHCDEIGLMVKYIDDQGFIYFAAIGGIDAHLVPGQRVYIHGQTRSVLGVVGKKPIHLMDQKDRETVIKLKSQFIDIGCRNREEVQELVAVGDPVTFAVGLERLENDRVISRAFDDKMGAFIVARVLQEVRTRGAAPVDLYGVSTVQEEIGLRGGATSVYGVNPDLGIAVEVGFATDVPEIDKKENGETKVGGGPIIARGPNINPALFELLTATAREENIPCQIVGHPRATGTDANVMQLSRGGVATALVSVPLRYMHTPVELLSLEDLENTVRLLSGLIYRIGNRKMFIPN